MFQTTNQNMIINDTYIGDVHGNFSNTYHIIMINESVCSEHSAGNLVFFPYAVSCAFVSTIDP